VKRSDLIALLGGLAVAFPRAAIAQPASAMHTVGMLEPGGANDKAAALWRAGFEQQLRILGWSEGQNVRFRIVYANGDNRQIPSQAANLVKSAPDVILVAATAAILALGKQTQSIPLVFVRVTDPVGSGVVASLARPGGNITGFANGTDLSLVAKRMQLLKEIAPHLTRIALFYNAANLGANQSILEANQPDVQALAKSVGIETITFRLQGADDIPGIARLGAKRNTGLVILPNFVADVHRDAIIEIAARHHLPAAYYNDSYVKGGGLMAYGPNVLDIYRRAATYVDRVLRGAKPGDLPIQEPSKYDFAINLKTANALGLTVPQSLMIQANEVIK